MAAIFKTTTVLQYFVCSVKFFQQPPPFILHFPSTKSIPYCNMFLFFGLSEPKVPYSKCVDCSETRKKSFLLSSITLDWTSPLFPHRSPFWFASWARRNTGRWQSIWLGPWLTELMLIVVLGPKACPFATCSCFLGLSESKVPKQ